MSWLWRPQTALIEFCMAQSTLTEDDAVMVTRSRISLICSWLVVDRSDRLVYLTGTRYLGPYLACTLVLTFLAVMAYPGGHRRPTASDKRMMDLLDRDHTGQSLRGIMLLVPPARLRDRPGTSRGVRPFYRTLAGLLALGALMTAVCPFMHRVDIRADPEAGLLRVRDYSPIGKRTFELPLAASIHLILRSIWPQTEHKTSPPDRGEPVRWVLELVPPATLPPMDVHVEPMGSTAAQPPRRARHLAARLADMTGWTLDKAEANGLGGPA